MKHLDLFEAATWIVGAALLLALGCGEASGPDASHGVAKPQPTIGASSSGGGYAGEDPDELIVSLGDGEGLSRSFVYDVFHSLGHFQQTTLEDPERFEPFLNDLATLRILALRAERELGSDAALASRLRLARDRVLAAELIDAEIERQGPVTEADLREAYGENPETFRQSPRVRFRQIVLKKRDDARHVQAQLAATADFATLARELSVHPSGKRGGDMGWHELDRIDGALATALGALDVGGHSEVVETPYGLAIVELQERTQAGVKPFEQVRSVVERSVLQMRRARISSELLQSAASDASLNPELVELLHAELFPSRGDLSANFEAYRE